MLHLSQLWFIELQYHAFFFVINSFACIQGAWYWNCSIQPTWPWFLWWQGSCRECSIRKFIGKMKSTLPLSSFALKDIDVILRDVVSPLLLLSLNILDILGRTWRRIKFCIQDLKCCPRSMGVPLLNLLSPGFFIKEKMWFQSLVIYLDISVSRIHQTFHITGKLKLCLHS